MNRVEDDVDWDIIQKGVEKVKRILEGQPEIIDSNDFMRLYCTIRRMCTHPDYSRQLYEKYRDIIDEYTRSTVLPSLREKHGEFMLRELVKQWSNHQKMVRSLSGFFSHLDHGGFVTQRRLPSLYRVGVACFRETVYQETKGKARDAVFALIDKERDGEQIDRDLIESFILLYEKAGIMGYYIDDFENHMLAAAAAYYSRKASNWILEDSCSDYMLKVEDCLKNEKDRFTNYLNPYSEPKLLEVVQNELLVVYGSQLLEKGCRTLLRDDKVDDLSRMISSRLFSKIPKGLELVANTFKQHVTAEGMALVQQAASNKAFVRKLIGLHDKFMAYVTDCFSNHTLFHKALKEAFEVFCNNSSSAQLLALYVDNIYKEEAVEENLDTVVKLLAYID